MTELHVYNTQHRQKELFQPLEPGHVRMYVCGVTVYDFCHLGHARCYVAFDIIYRYLQYLGYQVTYVQNITDLDDKLIKRARDNGGEGDVKERVADLARTFTAAYFEDMERLNVLRADSYPTATGHIGEMQEIVSGLIEKGYAYQRGGDVYFEVAAFPDYGALSGKKTDELQAGARVKVDEKKKSPLDFALWKGAAPGEPSWSSPWGEGRPGWHIECSAMSMKLLGPTFDIHGGGQDLVFPHHENERAQSEAFSGEPFARYWLHNGFVTINQEKMSKSLGNVFNLRDIFRAYSPRVVRFFLLSQHYRSPVDYSEDALKEAGRALFRLDHCYGMALKEMGDFSSVSPDEDAMGKFEEAMNDDFNTAAALAIAFTLAEEWYRDYRKPKLMEGLKPKMAALKNICSILGIELYDPINDLLKDAEPIDSADYISLADRIIFGNRLTEGNLTILLGCRETARKNKDWHWADRIRDYLKKRDITVADKPGQPSSAVYYPEQLDD